MTPSASSNRNVPGTFSRRLESRIPKGIFSVDRDVVSKGNSGKRAFVRVLGQMKGSTFSTIMVARKNIY